MRAIWGPLVAVAEWAVGLLVLAYVLWGMCYDHLVVRHTREGRDLKRQPAPVRDRRGCCRAAAALARRKAACSRS